MPDQVRPDGRFGATIIEHCTGAVLQREFLRRHRVTVRVLSSALPRHLCAVRRWAELHTAK